MRYGPVQSRYRWRWNLRCSRLSRSIPEDWNGPDADPPVLHGKQVVVVSETGITAVGISSVKKVTCAGKIVAFSINTTSLWTSFCLHSLVWNILSAQPLSNHPTGKVQVQNTQEALRQFLEVWEEGVVHSKFLDSQYFR